MTIFDPQSLEIMQQLLLAALLGALVGSERGLAHKAAGMRTYALVSLGACLFSVISIFAGNATGNPGNGFDVTRIAAQIVTGVGFIAAGIVIFQGAKVRGITTATGVWVVAAIGMAVGFHLYIVATFTAVLTLIIFVLLARFEERFVKEFTEE